MAIPVTSPDLTGYYPRLNELTFLQSVASLQFGNSAMTVVPSKIGLGGGCHWCIEGVFESLLGAACVNQG